MNLSRILAPAGAAILLLAAATLARAGQGMNYQGRLIDAAGDPVPGPQAILTFSLWDASTGGAMVWGDFQVSADLIDGRFNVVLGPEDKQVPPRSVSDAFTGPRFLQIQVGVDAPLPRQEILPAPASLHADHATRADHADTADAVAGTDVIQYLNPPGMMAPFAGSSANVPSGWLLCDGSAVKSVDHPGLHAAIGTTWGDGSRDKGVPEDPADPATDFNLPDLRGMFLRGANGERSDAYRDPDDTVRNVIEVNATSASEADLTVDVPTPFPASFRVWVDGLELAGIPSGDYPATPINDTTCRISGAGFMVGLYPGPGMIRFGRMIGTIQSDGMQTHRHQWGYYNGADLYSWNHAGNAVKSLDRASSNQIPSGSGKDDDYMDVLNVDGGFWTPAAAATEVPGTETRPNNAAVHYIIKE
jgi:hypothetical protein